MVNPLTHFDALLTHRPHIRSLGRNIALAALVGLVAGLGAIVFHLMCLAVGHVALDAVAGYRPDGPAGEHELFSPTARRFIPWLLLLAPAVGGLISGMLVFTVAPEAEGHGTDSAIDAYHNRKGLIRGRVPLVKMFASAITLSTGGSGGREGPIAQIGAGFGSLLATRLKLSDSERRVLMAAGLGAGIAAIFHAPLAGAIFAIEVLYRDPDFEAEALIPSFLSCTIAYCVFSIVFGFEPLFAVEAVRFDEPLLLAPLAFLAGAMAFASWMYVKCFYGMTALFKKLPVPPHFKPAIGGLATGAVALGLYYLCGAVGMDRAHQDDSLSVLSFGYGFLQHLFDSGEGVGIPLLLLLVVGIGKILTTSLTIGSGGSGGVFGPSMVIGGALGAMVGLGMQALMPEVVTRIDVFVILGMASFFAAAANTPVSTLIMVSEMTGNYQLLLPAMWVCALAYLASRGWSIYIKQVKNRLESPAHRGDFIIDILEGLTVGDALTDHARQFRTIPLAMPLSEVLKLITGTRQATFPVLDEHGDYDGCFGLIDVRQFLYDSDLGMLATAEDLSVKEEPLTTTTPLDEAIGRFASSRYEELPVSEPNEPNRIIGMIRRVDVIAAYNKQLIKVRDAREQCV